MGMCILVRIHPNGDYSIGAIDWCNRIDTFLGNLLPGWFCLARKANATVQLASSNDGGRIHNIIRIL